jgi:hypothetical protein
MDENYLQEISETYDIEDHFVFSVLGGAIGRLVDYQLTDAHVLSCCHFLLDRIRAVQNDPATKAALDQFAAAVKKS